MVWSGVVQHSVHGKSSTPGQGYTRLLHTKVEERERGRESKGTKTNEVNKKEEEEKEEKPTSRSWKIGS